jgi:hypothetical protein
MFPTASMQMPFPHRLCVVALVAIAGCAGLSSQIVPCPLTYSEQEKEILAIVPKGMRRDDALAKLAAAGIEGSFGSSRRVYYCELWKRPDGSRWHLNVALLFDEVGRLYKTQAGDCDITTVLPDKSVPSAGPPGNEPGQSGDRPSASVTTGR